jgi:hypothetical protein
MGGVPELETIAARISSSLEAGSEISSATYAVGGAVQYERFRPKLAKAIIDESDVTLARHYGLTEDELDFIVNYDVKYRMGVELEDDDD